MPNLSQEEYIQLLIPILRSHEAFTSFSNEEVAQFAGAAKFGFYEQGTRIIEQGDEGNEFFVVMSGQVRAIDMNYTPPHLLNYHDAGHIIGARALLYNEPRAATVEVLIDARIAVFNRQDWGWLLHIQPRVETYFQGLEREFSRRSLTEFPGRQWDEVVVTSTKRHVLAFLARLTFPLTLLIVPLTILIGVELLNITLLPFGGGNLLLVIPVIFCFIIAGLLMLYHFADWRNDDFIVTTKRFIHIERRLFYGEERDEAPLTRIQDVTLSHPGFLDRFGFHNLEIKTAGAGDIIINGIVRATEMKDIIFQEKERALARVRAANMAAVRQLLAQRLDWEEALEEEPILAIEEVEGGITAERPRRLPGLLHYLWPQVKEVHEDGTTILWRKHYWVLLRSIALPLLILLIFFYLFIASLFAFSPLGALAILPIQGMLGIAAFASLLWYLWHYDGWRRDTYLVTDTRIIDVESSPFRLRGETRSEGTFDDIQNITYDIPNFFSNLLNKGTVIIETAGSKDTFTFKDVFNPSGIQQEIFNRMVLVQQQERQQRRDATTSELLRLIGEYQNLLEKASAKGIIQFGKE